MSGKQDWSVKFKNFKNTFRNWSFRNIKLKQSNFHSSFVYDIFCDVVFINVLWFLRWLTGYKLDSRQQDGKIKSFQQS